MLEILTTCIYGTCHHFVFTFAEKQNKSINCINVLKKDQYISRRYLLFNFKIITFKVSKNIIFWKCKWNKHKDEFHWPCFTSRGLNHVSLRNSLAVMVARTLLFRYTDSVVISDVTRLAATHRFAFLWFHAASGVSQSAASRRTMSGWRGTVIKIFGLNAF